MKVIHIALSFESKCLLYIRISMTNNLLQSNKTLSNGVNITISTRTLQLLDKHEVIVTCLKAGVEPRTDVWLGCVMVGQTKDQAQ